MQWSRRPTPATHIEWTPPHFPLTSRFACLDSSIAGGRLRQYLHRVRHYIAVLDMKASRYGRSLSSSSSKSTTSAISNFPMLRSFGVFCLPLALVLFSALLDILYKLQAQRQLGISSKRSLVQAHAFATEGLQILATLGAINAWRSQIVSNVQDAPYLGSLLLIATVYITAILAIDAIDNKIQLGTWQHPVQRQTLLLTRSKLLPWSVRRRQVRQIVPPVSLYHADAKSHPDRPNHPPRNVDACRYRSLSVPLSPITLHLERRRTRRQGSVPYDGSVAKLIATFQGEQSHKVFSTAGYLNGASTHSPPQEVYELSATPVTSGPHENFEIAASTPARVEVHTPATPLSSSTPESLSLSDRSEMIKKSLRRCKVEPNPMQARLDRLERKCQSLLEQEERSEQVRFDDSPALARHTAARAQKRKEEKEQ